MHINMEKRLVETTEGERYILNNKFVCGVSGCCVQPKFIRGTYTAITRTQVTKKFCEVHSSLYKENINYQKKDWWKDLKWLEKVGLWDRSSVLIPVMSKLIPDLKMACSPSPIHSKSYLENEIKPRIQEHIEQGNEARALSIIKSLGSQIEMDHVLGWKPKGDFVLPVCVGYHRVKTNMFKDNVVNNNTTTKLMEIAYLLTDEVLEECEAPFTQEKLIKAIS